MRERHGDMLRCVAFHENYEAKSVPVEARMDVKCKCSGIGGRQQQLRQAIP